MYDGWIKLKAKRLLKSDGSKRQTNLTKTQHSESSELLELRMITHRTKASQTITTFPCNISQYCWAQHFARVWPPCCDVLRHVRRCWLEFDHFKLKANNTQRVATLKTAKHPQHVELKCCGRLATALGLFRMKKKIYSHLVL